MLVLHKMWGLVRFFCWPLVALSLTAGFAGPGPAVAAESVVTDIRVADHGGATRVVFELTRKVAFSAFTLGNPARVVIDLPEVGWRLPARPLPGATGVFEKLRYGLYKPGNSRVVLDIRTPAAITQAFILEPQGGKGFRVVIDLTPTTAQAFLRNAGKAPVRVTASRPSPPSPPPPVATSPKKKMVLVKGPDPVAAPATLTAPGPKAPRSGLQPPRQQATPFRLAPRKPEPKHRDKKHVVVIDPGHGGADPGTIGISGIYEKHLTLSMARELKKRLERTGRFKALLTRDRDIFIRLRDRVQMARDAKAELFISIHADSVRNKKIKGSAVYTLSEKASDGEAQELAEKENKADLIAGVDLTHETLEVTSILIDLAQRESMNQSARFAAALVKELRRHTKVLRNSHRFAGFAVLKAPDVPSVLFEMGFLSNPADERALRSRKYRSRLAATVVRSAEAYFARIEEATRK